MNSVNRGKLIIITVVALVLSIFGYFFYKVAYKFTAGSYPYSEGYELSASKKQLINAINKFKVDHPEMAPPESIDLEDGQEASDSFYYSAYFYYSKDRQLVHTWLRAIDKQNTTFAFDAINYGTVLGNWKRINRDFNSVENEEQKKKFEERILNKIKDNLQGKVSRSI